MGRVHIYLVIYPWIYQGSVFTSQHWYAYYKENNGDATSNILQCKAQFVKIKLQTYFTFNMIVSFANNSLSILQSIEKNPFTFLTFFLPHTLAFQTKLLDLPSLKHSMVLIFSFWMQMHSFFCAIPMIELLHIQYIWDWWNSMLFPFISFFFVHIVIGMLWWFWSIPKSSQFFS